MKHFDNGKEISKAKFLDLVKNCNFTITPKKESYYFKDGKKIETVVNLHECHIIRNSSDEIIGLHCVHN
tara:strand:- start:394 stop:600 length:207 start_codon:yes stop_codon:yes gene_type:complete